MNYLGHAYLSFGDSEILTGNLIADHVKGRLALEKFPTGIKKGIELHRKIDSFTDAHSATQRAKIWFRGDYGLYAGAIMDTLYDHFLANDPKLFVSDAALLAFTAEVYTKAAEHMDYFPEAFAKYFPHMRQHNWLYSYKTMQGMQRSLQGLSRRATYMPPIENAYLTFIAHYYELAQCYYELIEGIITFVKIELSEQGAL